jgi:hypothetical protein
VRFSFTEDQLALRDAVRDLLAKECPPEVVRAAWPEPDADGQGPGAGARSTPEQLAAVWHHLAEMGVLGLLVPEDHGGLGFDEVAAALVLEETGYVAVPHPVVETVCVAAPVLAATRPGDGSLDRLPEVLAGTRRVSACGRVSGPPWPWMSSAGELIMLGEPLSFVPPGDDRVDRPWTAAIHGLVADTEGALRCDASAVDGAMGYATPVADVESRQVARGDTAELAFDRAALGTAAQLIGLSRRMLDLTVAYVIERKQFGVSIGSFQAVKHHLADARLQLEFAAPAVYRAAWSLATNDPNAARDVSMAKAMASDCAHLVGRKALQCHGGIGYAVEYDLHLFLKRAWALEKLWGDAAWHRDRVGSALGV